MRFSRIMRFSTLWIFLVGLSANVLAQGSGRVRVLRVRKTGEFGKRIEPIATFYQPPTRHFRANEPNLETSETRRSSRIAGIQKPSQFFQLPFYTPQAQADQESQETVESPQGYAYPNPPSRKQAQGYDYTPDQGPVAEYPNHETEEEQQSLDEHPDPVSPVIEAEQNREDQGLPLAVETQENIDAEQSGPPPADRPQLVQDSPQAELPAKCDENDHNCWPHGYGGEIPGEAGTDYPILSEIVDTPFECDNVQYSGYYADADEQARCQIFHICLKGNQYRKTQKWSFLCPNGTVFSQNDFVCVWWNSAPECNTGVVDELSLRNVELGWDNITETGNSGGGGGSTAASSNFDVRSAMSNLMNANLQQSSSNSRLKNTLPEPTTTRRPYRVPVKVNTGTGARTQLKEVSNNALQGQSEYPEGFEHDGEETEAYETSLRQESEARRKTKTASALLKSESEAYEQKSVAGGVAPLIVNRGTGSSGYSNPSVPQQGEYEDEEPSLVMMQTQKRNPDGSEGYADVPVMMNAGYRYPNPTSTPGPKYLPPQNDYSPPSTTTESPTTATTEFAAVEESFESEGGYQYQTTEEPQSVVTTEQSGYKYPSPTTTEESGYSYPDPTTTTEQSSGYNYPAPTTTEQSGYNYPTPSTTEASYQEEEYSSPVYEGQEESGGYEQESTTTASVPQVPDRVYLPVTERKTTTQVTTTTTQEPVGAYLPPKTEGGYNSPQAAASLKAAADVIALPNADQTEDDEEIKSSVTNPTVAESSDYVDDGTDLPTLDGNDVTVGGYSDKVHIPTPASNAVGVTGDNLDPQQEKVNQILAQIQNGGAEVRDESGNKVDFEILKKLLSSPSGLLALQKADPSTTTTEDSSTSSSTESTSTNAVESEPESETPEEQTPTLETVQPIEDFTNNVAPAVQPTYVENRAPPEQNYFTSQQIPQQSYYSNDRVVSIQHPTFAIKAPTNEFESHTVQQNSIDSGTNQGNTFSTVSNQYQSSVQSNYQSPQTQYVQQYSPAPQQATYRENSLSDVEFVRPSVPQPERYYQQQQQQQQIQPQPTVSQANEYYQTQPQPQVQQTITQSDFNRYYEQQSQRSQPQQLQQQQQPQQSYFQQQQQRQPEAPQYLPPPVSTSQSQIYSPAPTQSRAPPRNLNDNIQLQQSFTYPVPQASSNNNRKLVSPLNIKIVPALFVHQHTRVEHPDGSPIQTSASQRSNIYRRPTYDNNNNNNEQRFVQPNTSPYIPYTSQTENRPVTVRAPRYRNNNDFSNSDAIPKYEPFTAADGRTAEQIQQNLRKFQSQNARPTQSSAYATNVSTRQSVPVARRNGRHFIGSSSSGSRGELELPSEQSSISYPGKDGSLGVSLTYN